MKTTLTAGLSVTREFTVERESTIGFMGEDARVYATPMLVRDIEITCRDLLLAHLDAGEDSVGTRVEINHLAPTLLGMKVSIEAKILELKGRAVTFDITASDGVEQIGRGRHMRFIVSVEQTRQRLKQKQAKIA
jgi:predicted thioesterase